QLVSGDGAGSVAVWDLAARNRIFAFSYPDPRIVHALSLSPDGKRLAISYLWSGLTLRTIDGREVRPSEAECERFRGTNLEPTYNEFGALTDILKLETGSWAFRTLAEEVP